MQDQSKYELFQKGKMPDSYQINFILLS